MILCAIFNRAAFFMLNDRSIRETDQRFVLACLVILEIGHDQGRVRKDCKAI
jgi:hypothetical protein